MNSVNKSVLRVNKFFKQLENYNSNKIMVSQSSVSAALVILLSLILGFIVALGFATNREYFNKRV